VQASCYLSLDKRDEAKQSLVKSVSLWLQPDSQEAPAYWSRVNTAKLLLELEEYEVQLIQYL